MDYKIVVTKDAEEDLDRFIQYLIIEKKKNPKYRTEGMHDLCGLNAENNEQRLRRKNFIFGMDFMKQETIQCFEMNVLKWCVMVANLIWRNEHEYY